MGWSLNVMLYFCLYSLFYLTEDRFSYVFEPDSMVSRLGCVKLNDVVSLTALHNRKYLYVTGRCRHKCLHFIHLRPCNITMVIMDKVIVLATLFSCSRNTTKSKKQTINLVIIQTLQIIWLRTILDFGCLGKSAPALRQVATINI